MSPEEAARSAGCPPARLRLARDLLRRGAVVAYPTEGVFGIGCDPDNGEAVRRVIAVKGRSAGKGLILVAATLEQALRYVRPLDPQRMARVTATWPGPVTWVLPARPGVSPLVTGGRSTVAVRVTAHPVARALCLLFRGALVSTSANASGRPPARTALAVRRALGSRLDALVPGRLGGARGASSIRDGASGRVLRG